MKRQTRSHTADLLRELQADGLAETHAVMAQNLIENRIKGDMPYTAKDLEKIITRIKSSSPALVDRVKMIFKRAGA